ncbi:MAG: SIMPL domain-containing protein [Bacteroidota bacterium]
MKKVLPFLILISVVLQVHAQEHQKQATISVSGEGIVNVVPDEVALNIRIAHTANSAREAKSKNDAVVKNVLQFCKRMNIDRKDIHTQYINLNKNYDYQKKTYHYKANQAIRISLRDLKKYETLVQGLLDSGTNRIDGVTFKSSQLERYKSEARKKAILNARQKAKEYANALQQNIGKAISISENTVQDPRYPVLNTMRFNEAALANAKTTDGPTIAIGEMKVSTKVQVTFELR